MCLEGHENPVKAVKAGRCPSENSRDAGCSPRVTAGDQGQRLVLGRARPRGAERAFHRAPASVKDVETLEECARADEVIWS